MTALRRRRRFAVASVLLLAACGTVCAGEASRPRLYRCDSPAVRFSGEWQPVALGDKELGDGAWRSDAPGASVTFDFVGTSVGLIHQAGALGWEWGVIREDSGRPLGLAEVRIDGCPAAAIDTSRGGRTVLATGLSPARHRVTVSPLGQPREPGGATAVVVKGFWCDAEGVSEGPARRAWLTADSVHGGEALRAQAVALAAAVKTEEDLKRLTALAQAAQEIGALRTALTAVAAEPPPSRMAERERQYWTPNAETRAYQARLTALVGRTEAVAARADAARFDAADPGALDALKAELRRGVEESDAFFRSENKRLPPILFYTQAPLRAGAVPNAVWQSEPLGGKWGCSIRTWNPAAPEQPPRILF